MGLKDTFKTHYETSDREMDVDLQTRYYKNNYQQCKEAVVQTLKKASYTVRFEDDARQELMLNTKGVELIVSMVRISPIETAVDFTVNTQGLISFGKGKKVIASVYKELDQVLTLKGIALKR